MEQYYTIRDRIHKVVNNYQIYSHKENYDFFNGYTKEIHSSDELLSLIRKNVGKKREVLVIAGAIGSGKSTFLHNYLKTLNYNDQIVLSPDLYMYSFYPDMSFLDAYYNAKQVIIECYSECIKLGVPFIIEMVPAKQDKMQLIQRLKENGYSIICIYLITNSLDVNMSRINKRVECGAFSIPYEKVLDRYEKTRNNIEQIKKWTDYFQLLDTTGEIFEVSCDVNQNGVLFSLD